MQKKECCRIEKILQASILQDLFSEDKLWALCKCLVPINTIRNTEYD